MKTSFAFLLLSVSISMSGCRSTDIEDEYFVKYILDSHTYFKGQMEDFNVVLKSEENNDEYLINQSDGMERLIGPVKKGFKASLDIRPFDGVQSVSSVKGEIHVSKNGEPFSLKKRYIKDEFSDQLIIEYIIDF